MPKAKVRENPWQSKVPQEVGLTHAPRSARERGETSRKLLAHMKETLAHLMVLRDQIDDRDRALLEAAHHLHDDHQDAASDLHDHIRNTGIGADETVEDLYGQHLKDRRKADELASTLNRRLRRRKRRQ